MTELAISTGLPRSGTNLFTKAMSSNPGISWACGPNIEIFREFRDSVVSATGDDGIAAFCPELSPFSDYFGSSAGAELLKKILHSSFDVPISQSRLDALRLRAVRRPGHDAPDLLPFLDELSGLTLADLIRDEVEMIARARPKPSLRTVGIHESWIVETFPAFLRAFRAAKAIIVFRDPRATVASMLANARRDPTTEAPVLGYVRHFRKQFAITAWMQRQSDLGPRLLVVRHEDLLSEPRNTLNQICDFMGHDFVEHMLDTEKYWDYGRNDYWRGNSAHSDVALGFDPRRSAQWKDSLDQRISKCIETLCAVELAALGYGENQSLEIDYSAFGAVMSPLHGSDQARWTNAYRSQVEEYELEQARIAAIRSKADGHSDSEETHPLLVSAAAYCSPLTFRVGMP